MDKSSNVYVNSNSSIKKNFTSNKCGGDDVGNVRIDGSNGGGSSIMGFISRGVTDITEIVGLNSNRNTNNNYYRRRRSRNSSNIVTSTSKKARISISFVCNLLKFG